MHRFGMLWRGLLVGVAGCSAPEAPGETGTSSTTGETGGSTPGQTETGSTGDTGAPEGPQLLIASDGEATDFFGSSVAVSGDTALVGAWGALIEGQAQGAAYVFVHTDAGWVEQARLTAPESAGAITFGASVAIEGDLAVVGAPCNSFLPCGSQGAAYVYARAGDVWTEVAQLRASDQAAGDFFGVPVALSEGTVVVGSPAADVGASEDQGKVYVFVAGDDGWSEQAILVPSDGAPRIGFGSPLALAGDTAWISATGATIDGTPRRGAVYVFDRIGAEWTEQAKLTSSDGAQDDLFGSSIGAEGSLAVVGAPFADLGGGPQGAAYVFVRTDAGWAEHKKLVAPDGASDGLIGDLFGSVALEGDTALIGAPGHQVLPQHVNGQGYLASASDDWVVRSAYASADLFQLGSAVALTGEHLLLGAPATIVEGRAGQGVAVILPWPQLAR
jgi:hypothetical protein